MHFRSAKHATDGGTSRRALDRFHTPRTSRKRRQGPILETLETRTLLSITPSWNGGAVQFTGDTAGNDQLILYETSINNSPGFAFSVDGGTTTQTSIGGNPLLKSTVTSFTVDFSVDAGSTLTIANVSSPGTNPWSFAEPVNLTGDTAGPATLETVALDTTWTLAQDSGANLIGTVNNPAGTGQAIAFSGVGTLTADPTTSNTLVGENTASTWTLGFTLTSSTYSDSINTVNFSGFTTVQSGVTSPGTGDTFNLDFDNMPEIGTNLVGGAGNDTFNFISTYGEGVLTGNIDGGGGSETINLSNYDSPATVNLDSSVIVTAVDAGTISPIMQDAYFNNITNLTGNSALSDQLTGLNVGSTWAVSSSPTYTTTVSGTPWDIGFSGFQVLQGGASNNEFNVSTAFTGSLYGGGTPGETTSTYFSFESGGSVSGGIFGQSGNSIIAYDAAVNVTVSGLDTFDNIGYSGNDSTIGDDPTSVSGGFTGINEVDAFTTGSTLTGDANASTWTIGGRADTYLDGTGNNTVSLAFFGFDTLQGGTGSNTFNVSTAFTGSLYGGGTTVSSATVFNLESGGSVSDGIFGQSGNSTINYPESVNVTVSGLDSAGYSGTDSPDLSGGFSGINAVNAAGIANTLTGDSGTSTWTIAESGDTYLDTTGSNSTVLLAFSDFNTLQGGTGSNTFNVSTDFTGSLYGGGTPGGTTVTVFNLESGGSVSNIVGQSGNSTINYPASVTVVVFGLDTSDNIGYYGIYAASAFGSFTGINAVNAAGTGSVLNGDSSTSDWTLAGSGDTYLDGTSNNTVSLAFSNFNTLQGGTGSNEFDVSTAFTGSLYGGGTTVGSATLFNLESGGSVSGGIFGQSGNSTINYPVSVDVTVSGFNSAGYSGTDSPDLSGGFSGINAVNAGGTANTLTGDNDTNGSTWTLAGSGDTYLDDGTGGNNTVSLAFSNFNTLQGGTGSNEFDVSTAFTGSLYGGGTVTDGPTAFKLESGGSVSGGIFGQNGESYIIYDAAVNVTVSGLDTSDNFGYSGNDSTIGDNPTSVSGGFTGISMVDAFTTGSTLTGDANASTWTVSFFYDAYSDTTGTLPLSFYGFDTLQGGTGSNTFNVSTTFTGSLYGGGTTVSSATVFNLESGDSVSGGIFGQSGNSTINYSAAVNVTVTGLDSGETPPIGYSGHDPILIGYAPIISGAFTGINKLTAATTGSTLTGDNNTSTWNLDTAETYQDMTPDNSLLLTFSGFDILQGGTGSNTFNVSTAFSGSLDGGGTVTDGPTVFNLNSGGSVSNDGSPGIVGQSGDSTINYPVSVNVTVSGFNSAGYSGTDSPDLSGGFSGINAVNAGGTANTLTGDSGTSTWTIAESGDTYLDSTGNNSTVLLAFSNFNTLQGGTGSNTFNVSTAFSGSLDGGGTGTDGPTVFNLNSGSSVSNDGSPGIVGQSGNSTINYPVSVNVTVSGLNSAGYSGTDSPDLSGGFSGINAVNAGGTANTLTGDNNTTLSTWTIAGTDTYLDSTGANQTVSLAFSGFNTLQGGTGSNEFDVSTAFTGSLHGGGTLGGTTDTYFFLGSGGSVSGGIFGQSGESIIEYDAAVNVIVSGLDSSDPPIGYSGNEATTSVSGGFTGINEVDAETRGSTLTGDANASTWTLAKGGTYSDTTGTLSLLFLGFNTLQGGTGNNTFDVSEPFTGSLYGGGTTVGSATIFNLESGNSVSGGIFGQSGNSTINYSAAVNVTVSGLDTSDNIGYYGHGHGSISIGRQPLIASGAGAFTGINELTAATTGSTLTGDNNTSTWNLGTAETYQDMTPGNSLLLTFSGFDILQGGTGSNTFNVSTAFTGSLDGGGTTVSSATLFNLDGGSVSGGIVGQSGDSTINYPVSVNVTVSGLNSAGYSGTDSPDLSGGFSGINVVNAGGTANTLTGDNSTSTWTLGASGDTYLDSTGGNNTVSLAFSNFNTLQGGTGNNTFNVSTAFTGSLYGGGGTGGTTDTVFNLDTGGSVSGGIFGQSGTSTINYSAAVNVTVSGLNSIGYSGNEATSVSGGFTGINRVNAAAGGTLTGDGNTSTWDLAKLTYQDTSLTNSLRLTFLGFGTLVGGSGVDTFNIDAFSPPSLNLEGGGSGSTDDFIFTGGDALNGTINGEAGASTLDYSAYTSPVTLNLGTAMSTGTLGISHIDTLVGTTLANTTLVGPNTATTWTISTANGGSLNSGSFTFSSVQNLSGGVRANTFDLDNGASISGAVTGGSTSDTLNLSASNAAATVNITNNNLGNVSIGGSTVLNFSRIANVVGTTGNDTFSLSNGKGLTGYLHGGGGNDTLDYSNYTTSVRVNLSAGSATSIDGGLAGGITGIQNVTGGSGNDILIGNGNANVLDGGPGGNDILVGLGGNDTLTVHGAGRNILIGGDGTDTLNANTATGENLLIGGKVVFNGSETNLAALDSLMAEWSRTGVSFANRCLHLTGQLAGGLNGNYKLITIGVNQTVFGDPGNYDTLNGNGNPGTGNDAFVAYWPSNTNHDTVNGWKSGDAVLTYGTVAI